MFLSSNSTTAPSFDNCPSHTIDLWNRNSESYKFEISLYKLNIQALAQINSSKEQVTKAQMILGHIDCQLKTWKKINENILTYKKFLIAKKMPFNYQRKKMMEEEYLDFEIRTFYHELMILKDSMSCIAKGRAVQSL